jgi:hypothetical protein
MAISKCASTLDGSNARSLRWFGADLNKEASNTVGDRGAAGHRGLGEVMRKGIAMEMSTGTCWTRSSGLPGKPSSRAISRGARGDNIPLNDQRRSVIATENITGWGGASIQITADPRADLGDGTRADKMKGGPSGAHREISRRRGGTAMFAFR